MRREIARAIALVFVLCALATPARADAVDASIADLMDGGSVKVRLTAVSALARSSEDRAVFALASALREDRDKQVRRAAALALKKSVTAATSRKMRTEALDALRAAGKDRDRKVRAAAKATLAHLDRVFAVKAPKVYIRIAGAKDKTRKAPAAALGELDDVVEAQIRRASKAYALDWPGELPTGRELEQYGTRAFVVAASVAKLTVSKRGGRAEIACTVEIRVAPWGGVDGDEKWIADQTGKANGSGKAITGAGARDVARGALDCVAAVGEQLTADQIVPFIRRLASSR